jgi:hypothetical protein
MQAVCSLCPVLTFMISWCNIDQFLSGIHYELLFPHYLRFVWLLKAAALCGWFTNKLKVDCLVVA